MTWGCNDFLQSLQMNTRIIQWIKIKIDTLLLHNLMANQLINILLLKISYR
jgi:hypothetical protein